MYAIILVLLAGLLVLLSERGLRLFTLRRARRYRLSFLIGFTFGIFGMYFFHFLFTGGAPGIPPFGFWLVSLAAAALGAFLGAMLVTMLNDQLWEDNAPPPPDIASGVAEIHQRMFADWAVVYPLPNPSFKRIFDIGLAFFGLLIFTPVWLLSLFLVWFEDPGPVLFVKNSVGRGGVNFHQFKIRSMVLEAEQDTGPILAQESDERILWIGRFLRKTALDELPQLLNILRGEMSFVGPRPQRTVLVYTYLQTMPEYAFRHLVRPGLAGLAQVAGDYYLTPRQKLRFDRLYIQYCGLGFDLKLLALAFLVTFWYRWQKDWNGRLPRRRLHRS